MIRKWIQLDRPILPKESGFVHAFTNTFLLQNVEFVPELLLQSEEEYRFYMELKRKTGKVIENDNEGDTDETETGFELGGVKVVFQDGKICVIRDGKIVGGCGIKEFSRKPNALFRKLMLDIY